MKITSSLLKIFVADALISVGFSQYEAEQVAQNLIHAELRGVRSHGLLLLPTYLKRIEHGGICRGSVPEVVRDENCFCLIDGNGGPGQVSANKAINLAIERALELGFCCVGVRNSNHVGMLAHYALQAIEYGLVAVVMANAGPAVAVAGGQGRTLGNNAICIAVPDAENPIVLDMATGVVACGKIRLAALEGEDVPKGWLVNVDGEPTIDPTALDTGGAVLPFGDYKGYGLSVLVDVFTGLLFNGNTSPEIVNQRAALATPTGACHTFVVFPLNQVTETDRFSEHLRLYVDIIRSTPRRVGVDKIFLPGEIEFLKHAEQLEQGVTLTQATAKILKDISVQYKIPLPEELFN